MPNAIVPVLKKIRVKCLIREKFDLTAIYVPRTAIVRVQFYITARVDINTTGSIIYVHLD